MAEFERVEYSRQISRSGSPITELIEVNHPATLSVSGSVWGHASLFTRDVGSFTLVAPDGRTLSHVAAEGVSQIFPPRTETVTRQVSGTWEVPPGVYTVQVQGTNDFSGGNITVLWVERVPVKEPEPEPSRAPAAGGDPSGGAGRSGGLDIMRASFDVAGVNVPVWGAVAAATMLLVVVYSAGRGVAS